MAGFKRGDCNSCEEYFDNVITELGGFQMFIQAVVMSMQHSMLTVGFNCTWPWR